ncbi:hypothetical protein V8B97DRAFT_2011137 [Scleroderma yunnanense]
MCVSLPFPGGPVVQDIKPPVDEFSCIIELHCMYSATAENTMWWHAWDEYRIHGQIGMYWQKVKAQKLFHAVKKGYFKVNVGLKKADGLYDLEL